jgi:hypothetical protein
LGIPSHLGNEFKGKGSTLAPVELVEAGLQFGPKVLQVALLLVEQAHRLAHHLTGIGELATFDLLSNAFLNVGGKPNGHRESPSDVIVASPAISYRLSVVLAVFFSPSRLKRAHDRMQTLPPPAGPL